uniref:Uncharacterized protein n=1 Tax=Astyanax mexicanus TaxID=7994 RepID=A0A3B1IQL2_ASTMX
VVGNLNSDKQMNNEENQITERFEPYQEPVEEDEEGQEREELTSTDLPQSDSKQESENACDTEEELWRQEKDRLMDMLREAVEERDMCKEELELDKVEEEKTRLSTLCDQLKSKLKMLKTEMDDKEDSALRQERMKLRNLRVSLGHLLVSFMPALSLEQVDFSSDIIDELLKQVLQEVTQSSVT